MLKKILIIAGIAFLFLPCLVEASIICNRCYVGNCECEVTDCDSGIVDIFASTSCGTFPDYELTFSGGYFRWNPPMARSYYAIALCSDGRTTSTCDVITARVEAVTTTLKPTTTTTLYTTTTIPEIEGKEPDYLFIALLIILVVLVAIAVYYFLFLKKKKRKTFEELYRKWGGKSKV